MFVFSFAGRGVLDFPINQVAAIVSNADNFKVWNKFLVVSVVLYICITLIHAVNFISIFKRIRLSYGVLNCLLKCVRIVR